MTFEIAASAALGQAGSAASGGAPLQVGYGVSLTDLGGFQQALAGAVARLEARPSTGPSEAAKVMMKPFEHINAEALQLGNDAAAAKAAGPDLSPSEMVNLTVRCQEFMFHCQLTSNIANRTSDGLSQLFRQQA